MPVVKLLLQAAEHDDKRRVHRNSIAFDTSLRRCQLAIRNCLLNREATMRRDMGLIRQLLLLIEDQGSDMNSWLEDAIVDGYAEEQISHHVWLLLDGGLIKAIDLSTMEGPSFKPRCLTWQGHEFLDAVRDKDIWAKTLDVAKRGGTGSLSALFDIAKSLAKKRLEKILDIA